MVTSNSDKWIDLKKIDSDDPNGLAVAGEITLKSRLSDVIERLPAAALRFEETREHVHQLRVATRRALAAVDLYSSVLSKTEARWIRRQLRRIRKACGEARDLDVLIGQYETSTRRRHRMLVRRLERQRSEAQEKITKLHRRLFDSSKLQTRVSRLLDSITIRRPKRLDQWVRIRFEREFRRFVKLSPNDLNDVKQLHRFRIQSKQLRYTIELLSSLLPSNVRKNLYPLLGRTQESLGLLQDRVSAVERMTKMRQATRSKRDKKRLKRLIQSEKQQGSKLTERFQRWWTKSLDAELRKHLKD